MASDVTIANAALSKLGEPGILAFTDDTVSARLAARTFVDLRDDLLREYPWNFASARASLAAEATAPLWGYAYSYAVPSDYLRLLELNNPNDWPYRIEGGKIVTDLTPPLELRYVRRVTSADEMDPKFREALAAKLAWEWAEALTQTLSVAQKKEAEFLMKLATARVADGQEDDHQQIETNTFISVRF